ncbi:prepilin-type N-terminal cleavage/methylation domain-containing protein/prepilin-type processing-associated H-X9-DG domain-containing protein [Singulisphaera sp. GP187]|uniref:DUF1559 family PulG-like putative transporter n=1 Tax=Singulisphaera sp. GP187 TaxID=1882752 RepID=UPI00092BBEFC|nr:DUF1559 domain-containing protein [Singulisphaera sp. GP187]SIO64704.1 prepilin-type N-terminal cleavage/methylation domain-containing protein/prepilin-type processing-associated H-X9-DG domain-containing protein [Singulisphaera sp. GP187]
MYPKYTIRTKAIQHMLSIERYESRQHTRPNGFTLIEILLVIAVIGLLVAMLLPAVQGAREAARRAWCTNNLKQMGLGLHAYLSAFDVLPSGQGGSGQSVQVAILPYLEQSALYNSINFALGVGHLEANRTLAQTRVASFLCPSDAAIWQQPSSSSYAANTGDCFYFGKYNGLFSSIGAAPVHVAPRDITDGMSETAAMAEWLVLVPDVPDRRRLYFQASEARVPLDVDQFAASCLAIGGNPTNSTKVKVKVKGTDWFVGLWSNSIYDHAVPINGPNCTALYYPGFVGACSAGSLHPGGANVLMGDGHIQFIKEGTNGKVWRASGTRNGGEVISSDTF